MFLFSIKYKLIVIEEILLSCTKTDSNCRIKLKLNLFQIFQSFEKFKWEKMNYKKIF